MNDPVRAAALLPEHPLTIGARVRLARPEHGPGWRHRMLGRPPEGTVLGVGCYVAMVGMPKPGRPPPTPSRPRFKADVLWEPVPDPKYADVTEETRWVEELEVINGVATNP